MNYRRIGFAVLLAALPLSVFAQSSLMAWYPLNGTPNDSTGQYPPMRLVNTPFQPGGGIYCNGVYSGSGLPDLCSAETPELPYSIFQGFTVTMEYKADSIDRGLMPVIVGGNLWRWILLDQSWNGTVELGYNGGKSVASARQYALNTWRHAALSYDSATAVGKLFIDGELVCTASFTIEHGPTAHDRSFSITNGSRGTTYKGLLKNLRIYSGPDGPVGLKEAPAAAIASDLALTVHPQPACTNARIGFTLPEAAHVTVGILDLLGREIVSLLDEHRAAGAHTVDLNATRLTPGAYVTRIETPAASAAALLVVGR